MTIGRQPVEESFGELKVTTTPLPFPLAQELLPEIAELLGLCGKEIFALASKSGGLGRLTQSDVGKLAPVLHAMAGWLGNGRLERLTPKLLASTTVVVKLPNGTKEVKDLLKADDRTYVFDENPEWYLPILFFAGRVTFARFFPASVLAAAKTAGQQSSPTSSPST